MEKEKNEKGATQQTCFGYATQSQTELNSWHPMEKGLKSRVYTGRIMVDLVCVQEKKNNNRSKAKRKRSGEPDSSSSDGHRFTVCEFLGQAASPAK